MRKPISMPTPAALSYAWSGGSLLGLVLTLQIITGLLLTTHYTASTTESFEALIRMMRNTGVGWALRNMHALGASFFFVFIYLHMARGIYYKSFLTKPKVWISGCVMYLVAMGIAFLGYVLPWGQMSYWGATVITNLISAIPYMGTSIVEWVWGGFSVSGESLHRFYTLHFILPFVLVVLSGGHLLLLHEAGSSNPLGQLSAEYKSAFAPYYTIKDMVGFTLFVGVFLGICLSPAWDAFGDCENWKEAAYLVTPVHIQPEWYFLFAYCILRSIPNKLGGVLLLVASVLAFIPLVLKAPSTPRTFSFGGQILTWSFFSIFLILTWLGSCVVEDPYILLSQVATMTYFATLLVICSPSLIWAGPWSGSGGNPRAALQSLWSQTWLTDGVSNEEMGMLVLHDWLLVFLSGLLLLVLGGLFSLLTSKLTQRALTHQEALETAWTIGPIITLVFLALPSLRFLYQLDAKPENAFAVKAMGSQWYWTYQSLGTELESFMLKTSSEYNTVDNPLVTPSGSLMVLASSTDVLHSWALPSAGIKLDCVPGRINSGHSVLPAGVYYGLCSELCGVNHSFMPIKVEVFT